MPVVDLTAQYCAALYRATGHVRPSSRSSKFPPSRGSEEKRLYSMETQKSVKIMGNAPDFVYLPIADAKKFFNSRVNLIAKILEVGLPRRTRGTGSFLTNPSFVSSISDISFRNFCSKFCSSGRWNSFGLERCNFGSKDSIFLWLFRFDRMQKGGFFG